MSTRSLPQLPRAEGNSNIRPSYAAAKDDVQVPSANAAAAAKGQQAPPRGRRKRCARGFGRATWKATAAALARAISRPSRY